MTREVDLVSYLPPFLAEFKEISVTLEAENPEFVLVRKAADRVLQNEFIESADEYGISRFENPLQIVPCKDESLEERRFKVKSRWFTTIPYTYRTVKKHFDEMCQGGKYEFFVNHNDFTVTAIFEIENSVMLIELRNYLTNVLPADLVLQFGRKSRLEFAPEIRFQNIFSMKTAFFPRANIPYLKYDGTTQYNGTVRYDKYKTNERIQLYPIQLGIRFDNRHRIFFCPQIMFKNLFMVPVHFESKIGCRNEINTPPKMESKLVITKENTILPKYQIRLKIGKHPNRYDGKCRYDGKSQYYVKKEEIL